MTEESAWKQYREILNFVAVELSTCDVELPELLFHYTSAESCFSIIDVPPMSQAGPRLWASCALGMNDAGEIRYGVSLVHEIAAQFVPKDELALSFAMHWKHSDYAKVSFLENTCIACFCDKADLLSQWRAYTKNSTGYCLGFGRELMTAAGSAAGFSLVPIKYEREYQLEQVRKLFEKASAIVKRDKPDPEWRLWRKD